MMKIRKSLYCLAASAVTLAGCAVAPSAPEVAATDDCSVAVNTIILGTAGKTAQDPPRPAIHVEITAHQPADERHWNVCYKLAGNGLDGDQKSTVTPSEQWCMNVQTGEIDGSADHIDDKKVTVTFGKDDTVDMSGLFKLDASKDWFARDIMSCMNAKQHDEPVRKSQGLQTRAVVPVVTVQGLKL